jgi:hypothetical protein
MNNKTIKKNKTKIIIFTLSIFYTASAEVT